MKAKTIFKLASILLAVVNTNAFAQDVLPSVTVTSTSNVSEKVSKIFQHEFKDATNVKWTRLKKDYLVEFITTDLKNRALYGKRGYLVYHIEYGKEKHLPVDVRHAIRSTYYDYDITNTYHVRQNKRDIWLANVEGNKKHIMVRMDEDGLEEVLRGEEKDFVAKVNR
jgi:hypothetical protein